MKSPSNAETRLLSSPILLNSKPRSFFSIIYLFVECFILSVFFGFCSNLDFYFSFSCSFYLVAKIDDIIDLIFRSVFINFISFWKSLSLYFSNFVLIFSFSESVKNGFFILFWVKDLKTSYFALLVLFGCFYFSKAF